MWRTCVCVHVQVRGTPSAERSRLAIPRAHTGGSGCVRAKLTRGPDTGRKDAQAPQTTIFHAAFSKHPFTVHVVIDIIIAGNNEFGLALGCKRWFGVDIYPPDTHAAGAWRSACKCT